MNPGGFLRRHVVPIMLLSICAGCIALVIYPAFEHALFYARLSNCTSNQHDIMKACLLYQDDHDGHYPPLSDGKSWGWTLILQKSVPDMPLKFSCPQGYKSSFSPTSDYFYNAQLARQQETSIRRPELTISFGEGPDNGPSNSHFWELPNDYENPNSVLVRHELYSPYAFADGHVKMLTPSSIREDLNKSLLFDVGEDSSSPPLEEKKQGLQK